MSKSVIALCACAILVGLLSSAPVQSSPIRVTINTSPFGGINGALAFDLIDGGAALNTVSIFGFATDGILGASSSSGDVSGALPGPVTLGDTTFFNEYLQLIVLGNSLTFLFDTPGNAANPGDFPDAFALFILDPSTGLSLMGTGDPTGANALFLYSIGAADPLALYSAAVTVGTVAIPNTLALVLVAFVTCCVTLRRKKPRGTVANSYR